MRSQTYLIRGSRARSTALWLAVFFSIDAAVAGAVLGQESYFTEFHTWRTDQPAITRSIAAGDVNGDGYLDLVCGNEGDSTVLYFNVGGTLQTTPAWGSRSQPA